MGTAPNLNLVPMQDYLRSESMYEPDAEYVDGVIEERPMGQWDHSTWQAAIMEWFAVHAMEWHIRVLPELRIRVAPTRVRIPDVAILDRSQPKEQVPTRPPFAVFEVLSPEDTIPRTKLRLADFAAMGVRHIWLVDPATSLWQTYVDGELKPATHFGSPGDRLYFPVSDIAVYLD